MNLIALAKAVQDAADAIVTAATPADVFEYQESYAKYGLAFIADVAAVMNYPLEQLKAVLPQMNQAGLIRMHRFDLTEAGKGSPVKESETRAGKSVSHQIRGYRRK